jgi:hypothetical protein
MTAFSRKQQRNAHCGRRRCLARGLTDARCLTSDARSFFLFFPLILNVIFIIKEKSLGFLCLPRRQAGERRRTLCSTFKVWEGAYEQTSCD